MTQALQRRSGDAPLKRILNFFKWFFMMTGVATTLSFVSIGLIVSQVEHKPALPDSIILTHTFKAGLAEVPGGPSLSQPLLRSSATFSELIRTLASAAKDPRVKSFVAKIQDVHLAPAQIQELRDTLTAFRATGKTAYVYADDLGGFSAGMGDYYLASAFDQIWLQPVGAVSMNGVAAEVPFFKGVLDKIGVEAEFSRKGTYKSLPESLTLTGMSAPHREMMTALVNDLVMQIAAGIAASRKMTTSAVIGLINDAPYNDEEALKRKLIDKIGYYDEMLDEAKHASKTAKTVDLQDYSAHETRPQKSKQKLALIIGAGDIVSYDGGAHAALGGGDMSADKIAAAFKAAAKDKNVEAIIFRIDSPGGSPEAAETIRHALIEAQKKGKPVIVSMGGYAASGGYWVATPADKIVAEPATITGSIGVFGGKFVLAKLWDKVGVHWDNVATGENARMFSLNTPFTEKQKAQFESMLDGIYQAFIARVMEGRKMTHEQVEAVAEGRVWTGRQAKDKGLVDELGGLDKAIELAKVAAKIPPGQDIPLQRFPAKKTPMERLVELLSGGEDASILPAFSLADVLQALHAKSGGDVVKMQEMELR